MNSRLEIFVLNSGFFFLSAASFLPEGTGTYTLSVTDLEDDFGETPESAGIVDVNSGATGRIEASGDEDWFGVFLDAGHSYQIDLEGSATNVGSLADPVLRGIYDSSGLLLPGLSDDDGGVGLNSRLEIAVTVSGAYYISAGAFAAQIGSYSLFVTDLGNTDDFGESPFSAGSLAVGGSVSGEIEESYDADWFAISLTAGHTYLIDLEGAGAGLGTLSDPFILGLYDANGALIPGFADDDGGAGLDSQLEVTALSSGVFHVSAGAFSSLVGTYTLSLTDLGTPDDFGESVATAGALTVGGAVGGDIEESFDQDWFAVTLSSGQWYEVDLEGAPTAGGSLADPFLRGVYDSSGALLPGLADDDGGFGLNSRLEFSVGSSGVYYISAGAYGANTGTYTVSINGAGAVDDYDDSPATTGSVTVNGGAFGAIETANDRDWFSVGLTAGVTYQIDLEGVSTGMGTLDDTFLYGVYDGGGVLIPGLADDDGGVGLNSRLTFTPDSSGEFFISAGGFDTFTGTYMLRVENITAGDDYDDSTATTGAVAIGGASAGNIETGADRDWFRAELNGGVTYRIDLEGVSTNAGTLADPFLRGVFDATGAQLAGLTDDDGGDGLNSRLEFTPGATGSYFISAGAFGLDTGTYTLSLAALGQDDDFGETTDTAGVVGVGAATTGEIETAGDADWFEASLVAGQVYRIDLEGAETGAGSLADPFLLGVYDSTGAPITGAFDDDGGVGLNSRLEFTATQTGAHYLSAGAFGLGVGGYKISVENIGAAAPTDDFGETIAEAGAVAVGGAATGEIETAGDADWFGVSLVAGRIYRIDLEGAETDAGDLVDPFLLGLHDSTGALIPGTADDDGGLGLNSQLEYSATSSGQHYISAGAFGLGAGTYKITVNDIGAATAGDDFGETTAEAGAVAVGGAATGAIETAGDEDWFEVTLTAGRTYRIDLEGAETDAGTLADPYLRGIYDSTGALLPGTTDDDGGEGANSQLEFVAATSGPYYVSAGAFGARMGTYELSVTDSGAAPTTTGDFSIEVVFTGDQTYRPYFDDAAATWESIITGDLPDVADGALGLIDDLRIDASVVAIDGVNGVLGRAGPRAYRTDTSLPYLGMMQFDSADLAALLDRGILQDVIEHEMGHVLGLGTLWSLLGLRAGFDYLGANALNEYVTLLGSPADAVPLETGGGPGTAGGHWSEAVFGDELMTGYAEPSPPMPLSAMTIGSLEDIGYQVDYSQAEAYALGSAQTFVGEAAGGAATEPAGVGAVSFMTPQAEAEFDGAQFISYADKPQNLDLTGDSVGIKLDGVVTSASETTVFFFETTTGNGYLVELQGDFEKNDPQTADDVKGLLTVARIHDGGGLVEEYTFSTPLDVETALDNWVGVGFSDNNYVELRAPSAQDETILTGGGADVVLPGDGNDLVDAGAGADTMDGGAGNDTLRPGLDADMITGGADADQIRGGMMDLDGDRVTDFETGDAVVLEGASVGAGGVSLAAGSAIFGFDSDGDGTPDATLTLDGDFGAAQFEINSQNGETWVALAQDGAVGLSAQNDRFITTSSAGLRVFGGDGDDALVGGAGADLLSGGDGADRLIGGAGEDTLIGGAGSDLLDGGADADLFVFSAADFAGAGFAVDQVISGYELGVDRVEFGGFADTPFDAGDLTAGGGNLTLQLSATGFIVFQGVTDATALLADFSYTETPRDFGVIGLANLQVLSGDSDRFITVDDTANEVRGGGGDDALIGGDGDDTLLGGIGSDLLIGDAGADELIGGGGNDQLRGGSGADRFVFRASDDDPGGFVVDIVDDYAPGEDSFQIEGYAGFSFFDETHLADDGVNVTITLDDGRFLILRGITDVANVLADDFHFG